MIAVLIALTLAITKVPVIGILTLNFSEVYGIPYYGFESIYLRNLQQAGAIVVPIHFNNTSEQILAILEQVNGVFITGGAMEFNVYDENKKPIELTTFAKAGKIIFDRIVEKHNQGIDIPLWGTCMGFQLIMTVATMDLELVYKPSDSDSELGSWWTNVIYNKTERGNSKLLKYLSPIYEYAIETENVTLNGHGFMATVEQFAKDNNGKLRVVGSSKSRTGKYEFVSIIEGVNAPIYGTQFHPEVRYDSFHNITTISIGQEMANFFVSEARKNTQSMSDDDINKMEIYKCAQSMFDKTRAKQLYVMPITT